MNNCVRTLGVLRSFAELLTFLKTRSVLKTRLFVIPVLNKGLGVTGVTVSVSRCHGVGVMVSRFLGVLRVSRVITGLTCHYGLDYELLLNFSNNHGSLCTNSLRQTDTFSKTNGTLSR